MTLRSFKLFRQSLADIEIITYDDLFRKVNLFALKRARKDGKRMIAAIVIIRLQMNL